MTGSGGREEFLEIENEGHLLMETGISRLEEMRDKPYLQIEKVRDPRFVISLQTVVYADRTASVI